MPGSGGTAGGPAVKIAADGWLDGAQPLASTHCDARPPGCAIELIVIHCISLPPGCFGGDAIERLFTGRLDPGAHPYYATLGEGRVSAHFLIRRDGALLQFVSCAQRAWHAGVSRWDGRERCNDFSIGVELEGSEFETFTAAQYAALRSLQDALWTAYPIRWARGHSEIAPQRKRDPGPLFDWSLVRRD